MIDTRFIYLAVAIELIGVTAYAYDTFRGKTQPNRVTWALWTVVPFIAFFAQLSEGAGLATLLTLAVAVGPLLVLLASALNKASYWQLTRFDIICGAISILALILWYVTGTGTVAIVLSMLADFMAGVPTLVKSYKNPETESSNAFLAGIFSPIITILTLKHFDLPNGGFALYLLLNAITLYILIQFKNFRPPGYTHHSVNEGTI